MVGAERLGKKTLENGLNMLEKCLDFIKFAQNGAANHFTVDLLIIVGKKVPETGDPCKAISKPCLKQAVFSQNVKGLGVGLRGAQALVLDDQFRQNNTAIGKEIEVMQ
jgi:hypothetical protein